MKSLQSFVNPKPILYLSASNSMEFHESKPLNQNYSDQSLAFNTEKQLLYTIS